MEKVNETGYISKKSFGEICGTNGHVITMKCNKTTAVAVMYDNTNSTVQLMKLS
jgi:hypothetical protein